MTTPTKNPIPSGLPQDFRYNIEKTDEVVTSQDDYYTDRFGIKRLTFEGMNRKYNNKLASLGWQEMGDFAAGIIIENRSQIIFWNGSWYQFVGQLPHTITTNDPNTDGGIFSDANPDGLWVNMGTDLTLRVDLSSKNGYSNIGELQSISDFFGLIGFDGARVKLRSWRNSSSNVNQAGGGDFIYRANKLKSNHNGGTSISPSVPWDGSQLTIGDYLSGVGETDPDGSGVWVRDYTDSVNLNWFGAVADGITDNSSSLFAARDYIVSLTNKRKLYIPSGIYAYVSGPNWAKKGIHVFGDGKNNSILKCTTAQRAFIIDASEYGQSVVYDIVLENFCVEGHSGTQDLIYVENASHLTIRNINTREANSTSGCALRLLFTVASVVDNFTCSINEQIMTSKPYYGIQLGVSPSRNLRSTCNVIKNPIIEGVAGTGISLTSADCTTVIGGTSEANGIYGITLGTICRANTFVGMGFEANGTADILDGGINTSIENCYSGKALIFLSSSKMPKVCGGLHERIETQSGCTSATIENLTIKYFNTPNGGIVDNGTNSGFRNIFDANLNSYTYPKKARAAITVTASPFVYKNTSGGFENVLIVGGTVTQVIFSRLGSNTLSDEKNGFILLAPEDEITVSYGTAPTMSKVPMGENYL